jgi:hypothetical protein
MLAMLRDPQVAFSFGAFVVSCLALSFIVAEMYVVPAIRRSRDRQK